MTKWRYTKRQRIVGFLVLWIALMATNFTVGLLVSDFWERLCISVLAGIVIGLSYAYTMRKFFGKQS